MDKTELEEIESKQLDALHFYLCSKDFNENFNEEEKNLNLSIELDSSHNSQEFIKEQEKQFKKLAAIPKEKPFIDDEDYIQTWENHLYNETKASILKTHFFEQQPPEQVKLVYANQIGVAAQDQVSSFRKLGFQRTETNDNFYAQHDFVIVSEKNLLNAAKSYIAPLYRFYKNNFVFIQQNKPKESYPEFGEHLLGVVEYVEKEVVTIKVVLKNNLKELNQFWFMQKFANITSNEREFQALQNIDLIDLKDIIINPFNVQASQEYFGISEELEDYLKKHYNLSQMEAIYQSLKKEGITLIQGPPGTGKTSTVIATVSALLNSFNKPEDELQIKKRSSYEQGIFYDDDTLNAARAMPWMFPDYHDWRDNIFEDMEANINNKPLNYQKGQPQAVQKKNTESIKVPEKILICGPSNAAIDEIIRKILEKGLINDKGQEYSSEGVLVRIGENFDKKLESMSLEYIAFQKLSAQGLNQDQLQVMKSKVLREAKIVCGTLSSAGSKTLSQSGLKFDTVIIDEAAQAVEVATLIPLQYGCKRLILIGDPQQLPATIFSKLGEKYNYQQSLFERLQLCKVPVYILNQQYRMHPTISKFISDTFYQNKIIDGENIQQIIGKQAFYNYVAFQPLMFYHVQGNEIFDKSSYKNEEEAQLIGLIYAQIKKQFPSFNVQQNLGIITPYSRQVEQIRQVIINQDGGQKCKVEVKTVDGFQGREKQVIIFSTVRSSHVSEGKPNPSKSIGFLNDQRRMNVSLSRAQLCLIVVGDVNQLKTSYKLWNKLIKRCIDSNSIFRYKEPSDGYFTRLEQSPMSFYISDINNIEKIFN